MLVDGIIVTRPTILKATLFMAHCGWLVGLLWALRIQIDNGSIRNEPELLRSIMFYMFSFGICLAFCELIGLRKNGFREKILMFCAAYIPIGFLLAIVSGMLNFGA